jgi:hypothetical protein
LRAFSLALSFFFKSVARSSGYKINKKLIRYYVQQKFTPQRVSFITEPDKMGAYINHLLHHGLQK